MSNLKTTGVVKSEPVLVTVAALWLLTQLGALVVTRWHWMGATDWSSTTRAAVPIVTALIAAGAGWLLRRVVSPAWRWIEEHEPAVADALDGALEDATGVDVDQVLAEADAIYPAARAATPSKITPPAKKAAKATRKRVTVRKG